MRQPAVRTGSPGKRFCALLLLLGVVAGGCFGASDGLAVDRSQRVAASATRGIDATETLPECLKMLGATQAALVKLKALQTQVQQKKVYLISGTNLPAFSYVPVDVDAVNYLVTVELVTGQVHSKSVIALLKALKAETASAASQLDQLVVRAEVVIADQQTKCNELRNAPTSPSAASTATNSSAPTPGGSTDLKVTITFQGNSVTRDEKTDVATSPQALGTLVHVQSGTAYSGDVTVTGTLPPGYAVYVADYTVVAVLGQDGGPFSGITRPKGFGAATNLGAYVCKQGEAVGEVFTEDNCLAQGAVIGLYWMP